MPFLWYTALFFDNGCDALRDIFTNCDRAVGNVSHYLQGLYCLRAIDGDSGASGEGQCQVQTTAVDYGECHRICSIVGVRQHCIDLARAVQIEYVIILAPMRAVKQTDFTGEILRGINGRLMYRFGV